MYFHGILCFSFGLLSPLHHLPMVYSGYSVCSYSVSTCSWRWSTSRKKRLQKIKLMMPRSKAQDFCDIVEAARTLEPSTYGDPFLPQRQRIIPSATASDLPAQEHVEGMPEQGASLLPPPKHIAADIPADIAPICINVGDTQWVHCCLAEGCSEEPSTSHATQSVLMCTVPIWAQTCCAPCAQSFLILMAWSGMVIGHTVPCWHVPISVEIVTKKQSHVIFFIPQPYHNVLSL